MESVLYETRHGSGRGLSGLAQKLLDPLAVFLGVIEDEMDFRSAAKLDTLGQFVANVADGCREAPDCALLFGLVSHHADEDARVLEVGRDADLGDGDEGCNARVFQFAGNHSTQLVENLLELGTMVAGELKEIGRAHV